MHRRPETIMTNPPPRVSSPGRRHVTQQPHHLHPHQIRQQQQLRQTQRHHHSRRTSPHFQGSSYYEETNGQNTSTQDSTPICRCRVLYLGSAVPHVTKDGLQGIQEPLKDLYPEEGATRAKGIDSWLSVWSNGFLLENVDEQQQEISRFFPVECLHYCAAVRYVLVPGSFSSDPTIPRFLPLDSPFARSHNSIHPPLFAAILRRTSGIKVLECHVFICKREIAANALVRCSFHSYADSTYAKHLEGGSTSIYGTLPRRQGRGLTSNDSSPLETQTSVIEVSEDSINSIEKVEEWKMLSNGNSSSSSKPYPSNGLEDQIDGDDNHKVWPNKTPPDSPLTDFAAINSTLRSLPSRSRPRQMVSRSSPPPPPPAPPLVSSSHLDESCGSSEASKKRDKAFKKQSRAKSRETLKEDPLLLKGSRLNGKSGLSSVPVPFHPHHLPPIPQPQQQAYMIATLRPPGKKTLRRFMGGSQPPPLLMLPPSYPSHYHHHHHLPYMPSGTVMEEPIYMPQHSRPLSPLASYQPGHFPHEAYYNQQVYATIDKANKYRKKNEMGEGGAKSLKKSSGKKKGSSENLDFGNSRRSHYLNEKAFSTSIRNEQRSRSYGSLSKLHGLGEREGKDSELFAMVSDLHLNEDKIERTVVPPGLWNRSRKQIKM